MSFPSPFRLHRYVLTSALLSVVLAVHAQVGEHRNEFAVGPNVGYIFSNVGFTPSVSQKMHGGFTVGATFKYTTEKYFKTICSLVAEVNYANIGWKEDILDAYDKPVVNAVTGRAEEYQRHLHYVQVPVFAHLAWGKEHKGWQFFAQAGPQFGFLLSESTSTNFDLATADISQRSNQIIAQDTMGVQNRFDYGIAAGLGAELSMPKMGHMLIEARYYYGLGNIYHDSKSDYFGKSNLGNIVLKLTWLFDIGKKKSKKTVREIDVLLND